MDQESSKHFKMEQLGEGVYAAIALPGGAAYSNAGIIDLGGETLIFDTFDTPQAAQDLRAAAEHLTGRPPAFVVNSHWHGDHWGGNQLFVDSAAIIATHETLERMRPEAEEMAAAAGDPAPLVDAIRKNEERLSIEIDERWRVSLRGSIARLRQELETLPQLAAQLPTLTFEGSLVFHGKKRRADVVTWGVGHTTGDCFLLLAEERIAFAGDLGFFHCQPFMGSSEPQAWIAHSGRLALLEVDVYVPGHGPLGTKGDLALQTQYMTAMEEMVTQVVRAGGTVEQALAQRPPQPFDAWLEGGMFRYEANVRFLFERLEGK